MVGQRVSMISILERKLSKVKELSFCIVALLNRKMCE